MRVLGQKAFEESKREARDSVPLAERAAGAFAWRFLSESLKFLLQLTAMVILVRLLPVDAFGLLTFAMIVINLGSRISQIGLAPAVIQRKFLTEVHIRVAFSLSVFSGILLATLLWFGAPLVAAAFGTEVISPVLRLISVWFLLTGFGTTAEALSQRRLDYRKLLVIELLSYGIGFVSISIALALLGCGVWALAWGIVAQAFLKAWLLLLLCPHSMRPGFARNEARDLLAYGIGTSLSSVANFMAQNGDYFVVGRWLGATALGLYSRAYSLISLPMYQFSSVISNVLFPIYSMIQNDTGRLKRSYLLSVSVSAIVVMPVLTVLAITAPEVMAGIFGPNWLPATIPLQILCIGGVFHAMYNLGDSVIRAIGAVYLKFWCHAVYAVCVVAGSVIGSHWGISGVAVGVVGALAIIYTLIGGLSIRLTQSSWAEFFSSQLPGAILSAAVAAFVLPISLGLRGAGFHPLVILMISFTASSIAFVCAVLILARHWPDRGQIIRKEDLKALLSRSKTAYGIADALYYNALFLPHIFKKGLWRIAAGFRSDVYHPRKHQVLLTWEVPFPDLDTPSNLIDWFRAQGIQVREGGHTLYLPPQEELSKIIPQLVKFYPNKVGFKILKDFRHPAQARYIYKHSRILVMLRRLIGTPRDQLVAANHMCSLGIGPRVWDLACLEAHGRSYSVFIVDHVTGDRPTSEQCGSFLERLKHLNVSSQLRVLVPHWEQSEDFMPPHCNNNLIYSTALGHGQYIDFQNFGLINPRAWSNQIVSNAKEAFRLGEIAPLRKDKSPDRSGTKIVDAAERNMAEQWAVITNTLHKASLNLNGRVVLDIGCNLGMLLHCSLAAGAAWGFGWDRPEVVAHAQDLLFSLGTTRFSLMAADLHPLYPLEFDIPSRLQIMLNESVVFYHCGYEGAEMLRSLRMIPWRALVFKDYPLEDDASLFRTLLTNHTEVIRSTYPADDGRTARMAIILRGQMATV